MALPLETGPPGETRERTEDRAAGASHGYLAPAVGAHREHGRATSQTDGRGQKQGPSISYMEGPCGILPDPAASARPTRRKWRTTYMRPPSTTAPSVPAIYIRAQMTRGMAVRSRRITAAATRAPRTKARRTPDSRRKSEIGRQDPARVPAVDVPHERRVDVVAEQFLSRSGSSRAMSRGTARQWFSCGRRAGRVFQDHAEPRPGGLVRAAPVPEAAQIEQGRSG